VKEHGIIKTKVCAVKWYIKWQIAWLNDVSLRIAGLGNLAGNPGFRIPGLESQADTCLVMSLLLARPRRCLTLSNPVPWQNWMAAFLRYTLRMRTLFRGWPIMVNDTHTRRRRLLFRMQLLSIVSGQCIVLIKTGIISGKKFSAKCSVKLFGCRIDVSGDECFVWWKCWRDIPQMCTNYFNKNRIRYDLWFSENFVANCTCCLQPPVPVCLHWIRKQQLQC